jgi:hypothetical protein
MMKTRKIALLATIAVLACVCVLQIVFSGGDSVREVKFTGKPDSLVLARGSLPPVSLVKDGDKWLIGDKKYPADGAAVERMLEALSSIRVLGTVSSGGDYDRYGLTDDSRLTVTASLAGKALRTVAIGKNSVTAQQTYALLDGAKSVSLVSGNYGDIFGKTADELRGKDIWVLDAEGITRVDAAGFSVAKAGTPAVWTAVPSAGGAALKLDADKVGSWVKELASLKAESFAPENAALPSKPLAKIVITGAGKTVDLSIQAKDGDGRYLCTSSSTPYPFYVPSVVANRFLKPAKDFEK